jgi:uncharacterized protein YjiS (DUF1127 family)
MSVIADRTLDRGPAGGAVNARRYALAPPMTERAGVATAAEVDIDTLVERLRSEAVANHASIMLPPLVGAWARLPFAGLTGMTSGRRRPRSRWTSVLFAILSQLTATLTAELRARRAAAELAAMDDRMLCDIGVSRSEIERVVRCAPRPNSPGIAPRFTGKEN